MDVVVTYDSKIFIIELKIWHGEQYEMEGYDQLAGYVKSQHENKGYLVSFCDLQKRPREGKTFVHDDVEIHEVVIVYRDIM